IEGGLGQAEIVLTGVSQHVVAPAKALLDGVERVAEPLVVGGQETHVDQLEKARVDLVPAEGGGEALLAFVRSEEHTSELQSLMRISYAVFCLKKTNTIT